MKVLLFCCKGFEMMEFAPFYDVVGWAKSEYGYDIELDTCGFNASVPSAFWSTEIRTDKLIQDIRAEDYDALAIPGGDHLYGFFEEAYDERFLKLIRDFNNQEKIIASVCVAALPIGKSGVLAGRNATTYHLADGYRQKELAGYGVNVINEPVILFRLIVPRPHRRSLSKCLKGFWAKRKQLPSGSAWGSDKSPVKRENL